MRYSVIETHTTDEETRTFGKHSEVSVTSLYEIRTLATISEDLENTENEEPGKERVSPSVITEGNEKWLAIAVDDDVSIFASSFDLEHLFTQPFKSGTNICGIGWIGNSHILAIVSSSMEITFVSAKLKAMLTTISLPSSSPCKRAFLSSSIISDSCHLVVARQDGEIFTVQISEWSLLESSSGEMAAECCRTSFGNPRYLRLVQEVSLNNVVSNGDFIIATPATPAPLRLHRAGNSKANRLGGVEEAVSFIRVRCDNSGRFMLGLTVDGLFVVIDLWTYSTVLQKQIKTNTAESFTDFIMVTKLGIHLKMEMIAVIVKNVDCVEMQVRSLLNSETTFRVVVSDDTRLLPVSEVADRIILFVEPTLMDTTRISGVKVREIVEAQPEMKLRRLISRNQLDQAEQFAIQFQLDLQIVHVARMNYLFSLAVQTNSFDEFSKLLECLDNVEDHNMVGEICFSGAITFDNYEKIIALLAYSKKRAITDSETVDRLSQVSYVLATYRLMNGPENARFDANSLWQYFVSGVQGEGRWDELFLHTLDARLVKEARILWNRHFNSIMPYFTNEDNEEVAEKNMQDFFKVLREALLSDISMWRDAIAFLEFDFVPAYLWKSAKQISTLLVDFLLHLAVDLESLDGENFPLNALHATSLFDRTLRRLVNETITATRQAELVYVGSLICSDAAGSESKLRELDIYSENLKAIDRLKTVYHCPLSYGRFINLTSEQICYQILQQSVQNPNFVKENVEKYARQYMAEHNLEQDETLYRYIEDVSSRSRGVVGMSNAWHDHCLLISETIVNLSVRCKAICMIAKGAHPPWTRRLSDAVESVLKNKKVDQDIKNSLEAICRRAELGKMMMAYSTPLGMRDAILASDHNFIKFVRFMFAHDRYNITQRFADAIKSVELYFMLKENHSSRVSSVRVYVIFAGHLQRIESADLTVLQFLEQIRTEKGYQLFHDVTCNLVDTWRRRIDSPISAWTENALTLRLRLIMATQSVILRFMSEDNYYMEVYEMISSIQELQKKYGMYVTTSHLESKSWREYTLKDFIIRKEPSIIDIFLFSKLLRMSRDEASLLSLRLTAEMGNLMGTLTIIRDALRNVPNPSSVLAEACVHGCEFVLWRLQETVGNVKATTDPDTVEEFIDCVVVLSRVLHILEPIIHHSLLLSEAVFLMYGYVHIFLQIVEQCMLDDATNDAHQKNLDKNNGLLSHGGCRIYGVRRRVGIYQLRNEGPLFARMEAIAYISAVAQSAVRTDKLEEQMRSKLYEDQISKWNDLFTFLSTSNQDLLEFQARAYAALLPCWKQAQGNNHPSLGLRSPIRNVCFRAIQTHPCDLWTPCTLLSSLPPSVIEEVVLDLRNIIANRKSPQTMINFLRIVQSSMFLTGNNTHAKVLVDTFIKTLWAKRLGKAGLPQTLQRKSIEAVISEFAKHMLDPNVVSEYVDQFYGVQKLPSHLLNYAIELVHLASASNNEQEIFDLLEVAHRALKVNEIPITKEEIFIAFRDVLYTVSPYNYSVLSFIISYLSTTSDDENREFISGCKSILNFLMERRRQNSICKVEVSWFTNREKQMFNDRKDPAIENFGAYCRDFFEKGTRSISYNVSTTSSLDEDKNDDLYERGVVVIAMPDEAKRCLPFHPFLYLAADDIERFLVPIIEKEIDIYNVLCWQSIFRSIPWLRNSSHFSRSRLLSVAVGTISTDIIAKGQALSSKEEVTINHLLKHSSSRNAVVNCVAMCFKKLPLCETKIRLLQLGQNVAQHWLMMPEIEPPIDSSERMAIEEQIDRLTTAIEKYTTELILKRNGLYNEKTCDLIEVPTELICYLYSNSINWKSKIERLKQMAIVEQLANANHVTNLAQIQENLVMTWLAADKMEDAYVVDPNDTMLNNDLDIGMSSLDENEIFLTPFFDVTVDRIVHLLKQVDTEKILQNLISYLRRDASIVAGGFRTIVRAACVLLRAYNDEQLKKFHYDRLKICVDLDAVLYGRLLNIAHLDIPVDTFRRQEKSVIVRSLVAPGARWTPQLAFLVASLIVDNEIQDCTLVETVLNRLQAAQKREMFVTLLTFCRQEKKLHRLKNLAMFWVRAIDWSWSHIEHVSDESRDEFERWFYFAISCPVEGGRSFDSIRNVLRARNYLVAAHLINVVGSFTQRCPPLNLEGVDPERELVFNWVRDAKDGILTNV